MHSPCLNFKRKSRCVVCHTAKYVEIVAITVLLIYKHTALWNLCKFNLHEHFMFKHFFWFLMKNNVSEWVVIGWCDAPLSNVMTSHSPRPVRHLVLVKWLYPCPLSIKFLCYQSMIVTIITSLCTWNIE